MQQFRRFAEIVNVEITRKWRFIANPDHFRPRFLCQEALFHFGEKTALESCRIQSQKQPSGRESAPGAREKRNLGARPVAARQVSFCLSRGVRGRRVPVQGGRTNCLLRSLNRRRWRRLWRQLGTRSALDCASDLGARTFDGWLKPADLGAFEPDSGTLDLVMPSQFMADWVRSHFGERLGLAWKTVLPIVREVRDGRRRGRSAASSAADPGRSAGASERDPNTPNFDPRYRFGRSSSARRTKSLQRPRGRWQRLRRSASTRCSFMAALDAAKPTFCTQSVMPSSPTIAVRESYRCRPRSSWSNSSAR